MQHIGPHKWRAKKKFRTKARRPAFLCILLSSTILFFQDCICDIWYCLSLVSGFPAGALGKEPACQCRRYKRRRFNRWIGKIPLEEGMATTPVFLPGESPWTEEPGGIQSMGSQRVRQDWVTKHSTAHRPQTKMFLDAVKCLSEGKITSGWKPLL